MEDPKLLDFMASMAATFFLLLLFFISYSTSETVRSPYLSPSTFHRNYNRMIRELKIFVYETTTATNTTDLTSFSSSTSIFHSALLNSPFLTSIPKDAHLFYLPFISTVHQSPRSIARYIRAVRTDFPFWNRSLGADHFLVSDSGIGVNSDRNLVEMRKNSIQISPFPTTPGKFVPHKDLTLPSPLLHRQNPKPPQILNSNRTFLAFYGGIDGETPATEAVLEEFRWKPEVFCILNPTDRASKRAEMMLISRFCLFFSDFEMIGEAMEFGCIPLMVSDGPLVDLPFGDVIRWSEIVVLARLGRGGAEAIRVALDRIGNEREERMRTMTMEASVHFRWNSPAEAERREDDAFRLVMYQLWLRRHVIRYSRREWGLE